jgi:hypothetical protein
MLKFPRFSQRSIENLVLLELSTNIWIVDDTLLLIATQRFQFSIKGYEYFPPNIINYVLLFPWQHLLLVSSHSWQNVCRLGQISYNLNISCSFCLINTSINVIHHIFNKLQSCLGRIHTFFHTWQICTLLKHSFDNSS